MKRFLNWLADKISPPKFSPRANLNQTGAHVPQTGRLTKRRHASTEQTLPQRQPEYIDLDTDLDGRIEDSGPGKNVLIRNKYIREDTGTHETLTILNDSLVDSEEEAGLDPYNSGEFDRAKNWDKRFSK